MLRIANFEEMEVLVDVNENDIVRINQLDTAIVEVDAYRGRKFTGVVTQIANSAKNIGSSLEQVTNFEVRVFILPNLTATCSLRNRPLLQAGHVGLGFHPDRNKIPAIAIPIQCITTRPELLSDSLREQLGPNELVEQVFVLREDNTVQTVQVRSGLQDHIHIEILEGLTPQDKVVTGPYSAIATTLENGSKVEPIEEKAEGKETKVTQVRATTHTVD